MTLVPHNPQSNRLSGYGTPAINKILTAAYTNQSTPAGFTETTYFEVNDPYKVAVSIFGVDGSGEPNADNSFSVGLFRSLDQGLSWQLFETYAGATEATFEVANDQAKWQFRLLTKGSGDTRVRAIG